MLLLALCDTISKKKTVFTTVFTILLELSFQMIKKNAKTRKNLNASYIALWKPDLNEHKNFERLVLFRNGVT